MVIRSISSSDSMEEITTLLHKSYKGLADLGFRYLATHQDVRTTKERIGKGKCFLCLHEDKIVGTICYYSKENIGECNWYGKEDVAFFGQFGVLPSFQKKGIGAKLMDTVEREALLDNARELALDTAEGAVHLIKWYKKRNYRFIEYANWEITNYRSIIMSKQLTKT